MESVNKLAKAISERGSTMSATEKRILELALAMVAADKPATTSSDSTTDSHMESVEDSLSLFDSAGVAESELVNDVDLVNVEPFEAAGTFAIDDLIKKELDSGEKEKEDSGISASVFEDPLPVPSGKVEPKPGVSHVSKLIKKSRKAVTRPYRFPASHPSLRPGPFVRMTSRTDRKAFITMRHLEHAMNVALHHHKMFVTAMSDDTRTRRPVNLTREGKTLLSSIQEKQYKTGTLSLYRKFSFGELKGPLFKNFFKPSQVMSQSDNLLLGALMRVSLLTCKENENEFFGETDQVLQSLARRKHKTSRAIHNSWQLVDTLLALTNIFSVQQNVATEDRSVTMPNEETFRDGAVFLLSSLIKAFDIPTTCGESRSGCCVAPSNCTGCCLVHIRKCQKTARY